ncbi:MAG: MBL fold metallo-hydrolase [Treponema sp.]|jgi:glyoxylase-like metal-dependent hydrolase (beta-lactamase superfamily II)|nr:MBL fold metallo-hydrolase [Treponema sp.]
MNGTLTVNQLRHNIWNFNEAAMDQGIPRPQMDAYLVTGTERALVIDALLEERSVYKTARALTPLPLDLALSHGHRDHAGKGTLDFFDAGCGVYLNGADLPLVEEMGFDGSRFTALEEGAVFDLGAYRLEAIPLAGHTPGSTVFLEREQRHLYTGDAIGAGVFWMWLPHCLPLRQFRENLRRLWEEVKSMDDLQIFTGHRHQAPKHDLEFLADVLHATDGIISGAISGRETAMQFMNTTRISRVAHYKNIRAYCYDPQNI